MGGGAKILSFSFSFPDHLAKNSLIHERETPAAHRRHLNRGREFFFKNSCCVVPLPSGRGF